jgi:hypothetical protein
MLFLKARLLLSSKDFFAKKSALRLFSFTTKHDNVHRNAQPVDES